MIMLWRSFVFIAFLFGLVAFLLPHILWLVAWMCSKAFNFRLKYMPFCWVGLVLMVTVWITVAYSHYVGRYQIAVNNVEYASKDLPKSFNGFRIVQISDLHIDSFDDNPEALKRVVDRVNEQNADIILFTGDMTTHKMDNIGLHEKTLRSLKSKHGVVSVLGNHDFFLYVYPSNRERLMAADRLTKWEEEKLGWKVLRNASLMLHQANDSIAIAGVDNIRGKQGGFTTIQQGDLKKAMRGLDGIFTVLMTHDPSHWRAEVLPKSHAQVTLSGHTHAGQARLFGWSVSHFAFRECDGRYDEGNRMLYVNSGIGCTAHFRTACPSEITVIELKSK